MKQSRFSHASSRRGVGFTLLQVLVVTSLLGALAALLFPALARSSAGAKKQKCDVQLKSIALALDAFRQERSHYPASLQDLKIEGFLTDPQALHCPRDPRPVGSYNDFYTVRAAGDAGELPVVCCPFHEDSGNGGNQARLGRFTTQFATRPAVLTSGNGVSVTHPGKSQPEVGYAGMVLHGGDLISTGISGTALITFADTSTARLERDTRMSVLQSFLDGQSGAPLYTLVRQMTGDATYTINHGSRFDVATAGATAGARGTKFRIQTTEDRPEDTRLWVIEGKVVFTSAQKSALAPVGKWVNTLDIKDLTRWLFG